MTKACFILWICYDENIGVKTCTSSQVVYDGPELNHPFGLTHHGNFLFWSEYRRGTIYRLDQTTRNATVLRIERPPVFHMRVYNKDVQKGVCVCVCYSYKCTGEGQLGVVTKPSKACRQTDTLVSSGADDIAFSGGLMCLFHGLQLSTKDLCSKC